MVTVFYRDMGYEMFTMKRKWALSTETMDEEVWYGSTVQQAWDNLCFDKFNRKIPAKFINMEEIINNLHNEINKENNMTKEQKNIERIKKIKNVMYVKIDEEPRLSPKEVEKYRKQGLYIYTFCDTDDGNDIYMSYYPRYVNHYCDVLSNVDLGLSDAKDGICELSYDDLDEAGAIEMDCLDDFLAAVKPSKKRKQK